MAHGKGDTKSRKYVKPGGKQTYAQNPYGPPGSYGENKKEFDENMPKQGFKSNTELDEELTGEHRARLKGKTLLTTGLTY